MHFFLQEIRITVLRGVKVVRRRYIDLCCTDACQTLISRQVVRSREENYSEKC